MITYLINTLLCAAVMFLIYFLLLEREKMHRFNRFYLLFSIVFSLTVSLFTIKTASHVITVNELIAPSGVSNIVATHNGFNKLSQTDNATKSKVVVPTDLDLQKAKKRVPVEKSIPWSNILLGLYIAGTAFLLIRFIRNLSVLLFSAAHSKKVSYHGATLVLTKDNALPHSFLNYIFIDKEKFEQGTIEKEILQHELTHVNQKHSIDILLVELVMAFAWINPLLFLFRKAIMLNHEYLADDAVVHTFNNTESYRLLLFNTVSQTNNLVLSSPFNYLTTKKRLIMMTKNTSRKVAILKQIALIPLIAAIGFLLSSRVKAQDITKQPATPYQVEYSKTDAPESVMNEYSAIIGKYMDDSIVKKVKALSNMTNKSDVKEMIKVSKMTQLPMQNLVKHKSDKERLEILYLQMSRNQQRQQFIAFMPKPELKPRIVPTKEQYKKLFDSKVYGIWVNGWRVKNSNLKSHSNTEYAYYAEYKLTKEQAKDCQYPISVTLQTKACYEKNRVQNLKIWNRDKSKNQMVLKF